MNTRKGLHRELARTYFKLSPRAVAPAVRALRTIVVDTAHLTDGSQSFVSTWMLPGDHTLPRDTACRATVASTHPIMRGLHRATLTEKNETKPTHSGSESIEWTTWHKGAELELTVAGGVEEMLHYCNLTDGEREQITLASRRLGRNGHIVYAAGRHTSHNTTPQVGSLTFEGLVACKLSLLPGTLQAAAELQQSGIRLVYITSAAEDIATHIAHAAGITPQSHTARHGSYATRFDHAIYARATRVNSRRIIENLPQPLIVAWHSLADLSSFINEYKA